MDAGTEVEIKINARDGQIYYYDINVMSNFVADAPRIIGFDPLSRLVDYLLIRAGTGPRTSGKRSAMDN